MLGYLQTARQYLWAFVEIGFLTILAIMLIYLILGQASGVFVSGVADNVVKFADRYSVAERYRDRDRARADRHDRQAKAESLDRQIRRSGARAWPLR